jgi:hypothetical protein
MATLAATVVEAAVYRNPGIYVDSGTPPANLSLIQMTKTSAIRSFTPEISPQ